MAPKPKIFAICLFTGNVYLLLLMLSMQTCRTFSGFPFLNYYTHCIQEHSSIWLRVGVYGVQLLCQSVCTCAALTDTDKMVFQTGFPIYWPTRHIQVPMSSAILGIFHLFNCIPPGGCVVISLHTVALLCISLVVNEIQLLSMCTDHLEILFCAISIQVLTIFWPNCLFSHLFRGIPFTS